MRPGSIVKVFAIANEGNSGREAREETKTDSLRADEKQNANTMTSERTNYLHGKLTEAHKAVFPYQRDLGLAKMNKY